MADAVTTNVIHSSKFHRIIKITNISDGTGEAAVIKINKSDLVGDNGLEPTTISIETLRWDIDGFTDVRLFWDHTVNDLAQIMHNDGYEDYRYYNQLEGISGGVIGLDDPASSGGTGDLLLTTAGNITGDTYDITIGVRLNN